MLIPALFRRIRRMNRTPSPKKNHRRTLRVEPLEERTLLAAVLLASDGFESGTFNGGSGQWETGPAWDSSGDSLITSNAPNSGSYEARLRRGSGDLIRQVDTTGVSDVRLQFAARLNSFENSDKAWVKISSDGTNWNTVLEFANGQDDNQYHTYDIDIPDVSDTLYVRFDAGMNKTNDQWYLDDIEVIATAMDPPPGPPTISVNDATIYEGGSLDIFAPSGSGGLDNPNTMIFGPDGNLYVSSNAGVDAVLRYDGDTGAFIDQFVSSGSGGIDNPKGLAFGPDGNFYVSDSVSHRVLRYEGSTGAFLDEFITSGSGGLVFPRNLHFRSDGYLYVDSSKTDEVLRYDADTGAFDGVFVDAGSDGFDISTTTFGPDQDLYALSPNTTEVLRYDGTTGAFIDIFVTAGSGGATERLAGLSFGPDGHLYTNAWDTNSIVRFDGSSGAFLDVVVSNNGLAFPRFPVFDVQGNLYVGNRDADNILRYSQGLTVSLSAPSTQTVTVDYASNDGSATAGDDYTEASGTVTFSPGETTKKILLVAKDDVETEGDETVNITLSGATGDATIADTMGLAHHCGRRHGTADLNQRRDGCRR